MGCTVRELRKRIGIDEFREWLAFDELSPIGDERGDYNAASIAQLIAATKGTSRPLGSFVIQWDGAKSPPEKSPEQIFAVFEQARSVFLQAKKRREGKA